MNDRTRTASIVETTDTAEIRGVHTPIGCLDVQTSHGSVHCHDAPGGMTMIVTRPGIPQSVAILSYCDERKIGLIHQMDAQAAREIAASLMRLANELDPKGAH